MRRIGGRSAFWPAQVVAGPLLLVGAYMLAAITMDTTATGRKESVVRLVFPAPAYWFEDPVRAGIGALLLVIGVVAWAVARWRPDPETWRLTAMRYGSFTAAAMLLFVLGAVVFLDLSAPVFEASAQGLQWRFLLAVREHPLDQVVGWSAWAAALACYALSFGPARALSVAGSAAPEAR